MPNQGIFLKGGQNAFGNPDIAKWISQHDMPNAELEAISFAAELGDDGELTGHYDVGLRLTANFDQIKMGDGQTIDADPNSEVTIKFIGKIDCTKATDHSGGSIGITWAGVRYKGVSSSCG